MRERAPQARLLGTAQLPQFRLSFAGLSQRWGGSKATLRSDPGSSVPGVVYELSDSDFESLDRAEGSRYSCQEIEVIDAFGSSRRAFTYLLRADEPVGLPAGAYHELILNAYERLGFDAQHLRKVTPQFQSGQ
jgi:gamma-glutamylcyclotransferase (GGCT)/AIG2-like uncharacterized protein YtfP